MELGFLIRVIIIIIQGVLLLILLTSTCVESKHGFLNMSTTIRQLTCVYPRFTKREEPPSSHLDTPYISAVAHTNLIMRTTTIVIS